MPIIIGLGLAAILYLIFEGGGSNNGPKGGGTAVVCGY